MTVEQIRNGRVPALLQKRIGEYAADLKAGLYSAEELTAAFLDHIEARDREVGAFLTVDREGAVKAARASDNRRARGECRGILDGIPYAVKDNFCTKGLRTTCASRMLEDFVPFYDAAAVTLLRNEGCVLLGKLNMDEFAMGSSTEHSALGVTVNPCDPSRVPGGSSGGSAAAVAAFEVPFSLGSDTGGSVRQPAAFCGVYGLKPTRGVISRDGMIAMASSLDCVGILTRNAGDAAIVLEALSKQDPADATCCGHPRFRAAEIGSKRPLRVAVPEVFCRQGALSPAVFGALKRAEAVLERRGVKLERVQLPSHEEALSAYCVLSAAEAASNMARFDGIRYGRGTFGDLNLFDRYCSCRGAFLGDEVKRRILFGTYMLSEENRPSYYRGALEARRRIDSRMREILGEYDLILSPAAPTAAFRFGAEMTPAQKRSADLCAVYASLGGLPALSVPFGFDEDGLPLAVQLTAPAFCEEMLFAGANALEEGLRDE